MECARGRQSHVRAVIAFRQDECKHVDGEDFSRARESRRRPHEDSRVEPDGLREVEVFDAVAIQPAHESVCLKRVMVQVLPRVLVGRAVISAVAPARRAGRSGSGANAPDIRISWQLFPLHVVRLGGGIVGQG